MADIVGDALWLTVLVNLAAVLFVYMVALPLGVLAAARSATWVDYTTAFVGYLGLATPNFLLALILFYYGHKYLGLPIGGLMSPEFEGEPMSLDKVKSILIHLIVPTFVIGTSGAAGMMQRLRANMLDELSKPYVETAKAKGLGSTKPVDEIPTADGVQSVRRGYRQPAACDGIGICFGVGCVGFANHRTRLTDSA